MIGLLRRVGAALAVGALCWMTGCAGFWVAVNNSNNNGSTTNDYVYVANATAITLSGFSVGTDTLTALTNSPYSLPCTPAAMVVNPADTLLFVSCSTNIDIYAYAINSDGSLTELNSDSPVGTTTEGAVSMAVSPDGQWLLALDGDTAVVEVDEYQIDSTTGLLTQGNGASYNIANLTPRAIAVASTPEGEYVFAALGSTGDLIFTFNTAVSSGGALSNPVQLSLGSSDADNALAVNPAGTYLFIARSGPAGGVAVYSIGSGGVLTEVGSPITAGTQPYSVVVNTEGTDVYVANRSGGNISGYSIGSGGVLTALGGSPYASGNQVTALAVDSSGDYLLAAANGGSPDLTLYSYDSTTAGKLDSAASVATGSGPVAVATTH